MTTIDGLFTLRCSPNPLDATVTDLAPCDAVGNPLSRPTIDEPDSPPLYSVAWNDGDGSIQIIDPLSSSLLASTTSIGVNKRRLITLHNPTQSLDLKNKSLISFSWVFDWEGHRFSWGRSRDTLSTSNTGYTLKLDRRPDPDVAIASYKLSKRGNLVQILDYNLDRFQIEDRKGLEIVLLSSIFSILQGDKLDEHAKDRADSPTQAATPSPRPGVQRQPSDEVEAISENEIVISNHLSENAYTTHCVQLFNDPNLVFVALLANSGDTVPRAISIASEVKRHVMKHRNEDLMQFIDYPGRKDSTGQSSRNAPLAEKGPPRQMKIYLSRIPLEEFVPKKPASGSGPDPTSEKERIARYHAAQQPPIPARTAANAHPQTSAPSASLPAVLHKAPGRDPRRPPLPPKKSDSKDDDGKKKSFWSRVMADQR